jgi:hypothetical protein
MDIPHRLAIVRRVGESGRGERRWPFSAAATAAFLAAPIVVTWLLVQQGRGRPEEHERRPPGSDRPDRPGRRGAGEAVADIAQLQQLANLQKGNTEGVGGFIMGLFGDPAKEKALYDQTVNSSTS